MMKKTIILSACLSAVLAIAAQNRENPVILGVADAGVLKYAGKYYLGGVATYGDFYESIVTR